MTKHTILFLAANPAGTNPLALAEEARSIREELVRSGHRDCFAFETRWAVRPIDLLRELRALKPTVVHFCGHGGSQGAGSREPGRQAQRDVVVERDHRPRELQGLCFEGTDGRAQLVSTAALAETFSVAGASVKLVVLNACYSEAQADALVAHVDCVVGMGGAIRDDAARSFAVGFYGGLGERESVDVAHKQGRAAIRLQGLADGDLPRLKVREGVDADRLVLAAPPASVGARSISTRRVTAVNHAEHDLVIRTQVVHLAPDTTEQEQDARERRLERTYQVELDRRYRVDPMMRHRHAESIFVKAAGVAVAIIGAIALTLGQVQLGVMSIAVVGVHRSSPFSCRCSWADWQSC